RHEQTALLCPGEELLKRVIEILLALAGIQREDLGRHPVRKWIRPGRQVGCTRPRLSERFQKQSGKVLNGRPLDLEGKVVEQLGAWPAVIEANVRATAEPNVIRDQDFAMVAVKHRSNLSPEPAPGKDRVVNGDLPAGIQDRLGVAFTDLG